MSLVKPSLGGCPPPIDYEILRHAPVGDVNLVALREVFSLQFSTRQNELKDFESRGSTCKIFWLEGPESDDEGAVLIYSVFCKINASTKNLLLKLQ